jgi:hypothetical protein
MDSSVTNIEKNKGDSDAYRRRRIFTTEGCGHASRQHSWWILIKQACHEPIYLSLGLNCAKQRVYQIRMTLLTTENKIEELTISRLAA